MLKHSADDVRKYLVCERYKEKKGGYQAINLLPLRKDEKYGHLFVGVEIPFKSMFSYPALDQSMYVWRFTPKGVVERAKITEDLEHLFFQETEYDFCSHIEERPVRDILGIHTDKYLEVMEKYGGQKIGRMQRFVNKTTKLDELKRFSVNHPKKVASLLLAGTLAVSGGIGGLAHLVKGGQAHIEEPVTTPPPMVNVIASPQMQDYIGDDTILVADEQTALDQNNSALQFSPTPTVTNHSVTRIDRISDELFEHISSVKNSGDTSTMEYKFFHKYSSAINPELQDTGKGEFASVEEMLSAYEQDPKRFAIYGKRFLESMSLDYIKIQIAKTYGISDTDKVMVTYENPEGAFEIRVREKLDNGNKRELELPGYGYVWNTKREGMKHLDRLITGSRNRYTRLPMSDWEYFLEINEAEHYSDYHGRTQKYYMKDYNDFMLGYVEDMVEKVGELEQSHTQTVAQERDMDEGR